MKIEKTIPLIVLACLLVASANAQEEDDPQVDANFQGSFSSHDYQDQQQNSNENLSRNQMMQFAQQMGQFVPDETFSFKMKVDTNQQFLLYPGADVQIIRGMFHYETTDESEQEESNQGDVILQIFDNQKPYRTYKQQRLGIFKIYHNLRDHAYTFRFSNKNVNNEIYFSYQFVKSSKNAMQNSTDPTNDTSEIELMRRKFEKVNKLIIQQEKQMNRILLISQKHQQKINHYMQYVNWSVILETALISLSNIVCLCFLKKQIYGGYQLLV